jgi:hypothetical protein
MSTHLGGVSLTDHTYYFVCCIAIGGEAKILNMGAGRDVRDAGCRGRDGVVCEGRERREGCRGPVFILAEDRASVSLVGFLKLWRGSGE